MKKIILALLAAFLTFSLISCDSLKKLIAEDIQKVTVTMVKYDEEDETVETTEETESSTVTYEKDGIVSITENTITYSDGSVYIGEIESNRKNGYGIYYFVNGDMYKGNFKDDKRNGYGVYYFSNGDKYEGNFENNQITGEGTYKWANGRAYTGVFENGIPID